MKTTLLFVATSLFVISCGDSNDENPEEFSTDEMKSKVKVEKIEFDEPKTKIVGQLHSSSK